MEIDPNAADEATIISNMPSGPYDVPLAVIAVLAAGTSRDVSTDIARKVELAAATDQRTLTIFTALLGWGMLISAGLWLL